MHRHLIFLLAATIVAPAASTQAIKNVTLLAKITRAGSSGYAGVWGYVAPDGSEYAAVGARNGTWIVETTNPSSPIERGFISGTNSIWREISGYRQYLYVVTEGSGGVQIISMVNPQAPVLVKTFTQSGWSNTHSVSVDQTAGKLYCNGTSGGMRIFDISADPTTPVPIVNYTTPYVHDSFIQNGFAYISAINSGQMRILNVVNLPTITQLSQTRTPNGFTHNVWADSKDTFCLTTDETSTGYMQIYDVTNKALPVAKGSFRVANEGVHNVFLVNDKWAAVAWYTGGFYAVDVFNKNTPTEIGHYTPAGIDLWGCYPFQPSGNIYCSGIPSNDGLHIIRMSCGVPQNYGTGTAGSGGIVPGIDWDGGAAKVNNPSFQLLCENAVGGAPALLAIGAAQASIPVLGFTLLVDPAQPIVLVNATTSGAGAGQGSATVNVPIPNNPSLANQSVYAQWIVTDAGAPQGFSASPGTKVTICP